MTEWLFYTQPAAGSDPIESFISWQKGLSMGDLFVPLVLYSDSAEIYPGSDDDERHLLLYRTPEYPESG